MSVHLFQLDPLNIIILNWLWVNKITSPLSYQIIRYQMKKCPSCYLPQRTPNKHSVAMHTLNHEREHASSRKDIRQVMSKLQHIKKQLNNVKKMQSAHCVDASIYTVQPPQKHSPTKSSTKSRKKAISNEKNQEKSIGKQGLKEFSFQLHGQTHKKSPEITERMDLGDTRKATEKVEGIHYGSLQWMAPCLEVHLRSAKDSLRINVQINRLVKAMKDLPQFQLNERDFYDSQMVYLKRVHSELYNIVNMLNQYYFREGKESKENEEPNRDGDRQAKKEVPYRKDIKKLSHQILRLEDSLLTNTQKEQAIEELHSKIDELKDRCWHLAEANRHLTAKWEIGESEMSQLKREYAQVRIRREQSQRELALAEQDINRWRIECENMKAERQRSVKGDLGVRDQIMKKYQQELADLKAKYQAITLQLKIDRKGKEGDRIAIVEKVNDKRDQLQDQDQLQEQVAALEEQAEAMREQIAELKRANERYKEKYMRSKIISKK